MEVTNAQSLYKPFILTSQSVDLYQHNLIVSKKSIPMIAPQFDCKEKGKIIAHIKMEFLNCYFVPFLKVQQVQQLFQQSNVSTNNAVLNQGTARYEWNNVFAGA